MNGSPYVGPRPYRRNEAHLFHGRGEQARAIRDDWLSERVTVLHGPVAAGKTSLLSAGVLPLLEREPGVSVLPPGRLIQPTIGPLATPPEHNGYVYSLLSDWSATSLPPARTSIAEVLASRVASESETERLLVAIDQFEEVLTAFPARHRERAELLEQLRVALAEVPALNLLIVIRDDHLGTVTPYDRELRVPLIFERLAELRPEEAAQAITGPLRGTGRSIAEDAVTRLIDRLRTVRYTDRLGDTASVTTDLVEPLYLQILCSELWSSAQRRDLRTITAEMVADTDTAEAVSRFYGTAVRDVAMRASEILGLHPLDGEERIRTWIESVFITENGTRGTAFRGLTSTADMPNAVADALTDGHVLTARAHMRGTWLQLGQDLLIEAVRRGNRAWFTAQRRTPPPAEAAPSGVPRPEDFAAAAEAALGEGDFARALRFASLAAERYGERRDDRRQAQALTLRGDIALLQGDLPAAEQSFRAAFHGYSQLEDNTSLARTLSALAEVAMVRGDYVTAADLYRQAIGRRRTDAEALTGLGFALWRQGLPADADAVFGQALTWRATTARALAGRGQVRLELRLLEQALTDLEEGLALGLTGVDEIDARSARAVVLARLGRGEEARAEIESALRADPQREVTRRRALEIRPRRPDENRPG